MEVTTEAIKDYVFGDQQYIHYYDGGIDTLNAADAIYEQMKNQKPNDLDYIKEMCGGSFSGGPDMDNFREGGKYDWDAYYDAKNEHRDKCIEEFMVRAAGKDVYAFVFIDDCGEYTLEHGGTFDRVPHEQISNH